MNTSSDNGTPADRKTGDTDFSIHERIQEIVRETDKDRKSEINARIKFGDGFVKTALLIGFWGFWIFWLIVVLAGL